MPTAKKKQHYPFKTAVKEALKRMKEAPSPFSDEFGTPAESNVIIEETASDKRAKRIANDEQTVKDITLKFAIIALGAKLAGVDGELNSKEITGFKHAFPEVDHPGLEVGKFFGDAYADDFDYEYYARRIITYFPDEAAMYRKLMQSLFTYAAVDAPINAQEITFLQRVNQIFGLAENYFYEILEHAILPKSKNPYDVLGISIDTPTEEIKPAYRKAAQAYHPDRLATIKGDKIRDLANKRFNAIQDAYSIIKKIRKIK